LSRLQPQGNLAKQLCKATFKVRRSAAEDEGMFNFQNKLYRAMFCLALCAALALSAYGNERWMSLGPDGGDVRSFAYDPDNPDIIYMGSMSGKLFLSTDGGASWSRLAQLGTTRDYVIQRIAIDPNDHKTVYVAAWSLDNISGDLFRSKDGGKSWRALDGMRGKAVRALAIAPTNSRILVTGTLDGVYRSNDGGDSWNLISPPNHPDIRNLDSVAIDPTDPNIIYVGTWHLPWKTTDGGRNWHNIKKGVIDDSDVFSIIIDPRNPQVVYISACSGIYKSENGGELFHKIQGMPFSARRTRVLYMDPHNSQIVYAGTTEGLWKTEDGGRNMRLMTSPKVVINDIYIDPRDSKKVILATDRGGVLVSNDASRSFVASNRGFIHRQVTALLVDRNNRQKLYAGMINGQELGGVFVSSDSGAHWKQMSAGLGGRDVFALRQTDGGTLVAATADGVFIFANGMPAWKSMSAGLGRSAGKARVLDVWVAGSQWYAATTRGMYKSANQGRMWQLIPGTGAKDFVAVRSRQRVIAGVGGTMVAFSKDGGARWYTGKMPSIMTSVRGMTIGADSAIWLATREGAFRSTDGGRHFEHMRGGLPPLDVKSIMYDDAGKRLLATSGTSSEVYQSTDNGQHWAVVTQATYPVHSVTPSGDKLFVTTSHDGVLAQPERETHAAGGGGN
jgi:photosystem II stability/assembly factor-like uncharacterized protein